MEHEGWGGARGRGMVYTLHTESVRKRKSRTKDQCQSFFYSFVHSFYFFIQFFYFYFYFEVVIVVSLFINKSLNHFFPQKME